MVMHPPPNHHPMPNPTTSIFNVTTSMSQLQCLNINSTLKTTFRQKPQKPPTAKNPQFNQKSPKTSAKYFSPKIPDPQKNKPRNNFYIFSTEHPIFSITSIISSALKLSGMVTKIFVWMRCFSLMHILTWFMKSQVIWSSIESISFTLQIP